MTDQEKLEIDARINALVNQRNSALNDSVIMAGQMEVLRAELKTTQEKLEKATDNGPAEATTKD